MNKLNSLVVFGALCAACRQPARPPEPPPIQTTPRAQGDELRDISAAAHASDNVKRDPALAR